MKNLGRRMLFGIIAVALAPAAPAVTIYGLAGVNTLARFDSATPGTIQGSLAVTGLGAGEALLAITIRPATGEMLGLGSGNRLYHLDPNTGLATQIGSDGAFALSGARFGMAVNPVVDRVRVVSDNDQSLRLNPATGTLSATDTILAYAPGDAHVGADPNVVAVAYINSRAGAVTTTLYDIDSALDILALQNPPNNGSLNTVGPLGVLISDTAGLAIFSPTGGVDIAYAALNVTGATSGLYTVNLSTGAIGFIGNIGSTPTLVSSLAIPLDRIFATSFE